MMKHFGWLFAFIPFASITIFSLAQAATQEKKVPGGTDDYIKAFEEMFASPYQEVDYYRADRLLLTATGSLKPVFLAPSVASVITKEDIEEMGATTLDEALEPVPGMHVLPSGFNYFSSIWSIRGIHTGLNPHVLLLINGIPFKSTYSGDRSQTFKMPVQMISRIEVIRGPGSAVHGADAFSGVINVITKDGQEIDGTRTGVQAGSFDTYGGWLQHGGNYNGFDVALSLEGRRTWGDLDRIIDRDGLGSGPPSLAPGPLPRWYELVDANLGLRKGNWTLHFYASLQESTIGPGIQVITNNSDLDAKYFLSDLTYNNNDLVADWDFMVRLHSAYMHHDLFFQILPENFQNQRGNPIATTFENGIETSAFYKGLNRHLVRLGAGAKRINVDAEQYKNWGPGVAVQFGPMVDIGNTDDAFMLDHGRGLWYLSIQDEWSFARNWEFTGGVRYDKYSDFGSTVNPRAALVWETRYDLTTKLLYGRAFRAPSFGELYAINNVKATGNKNLDPEKIETFELVFDYQPTTDLRATVNLFTYKAEELIDLIPPLPFTAENFSEQEGRGFEIELDWEITEDLRLGSNFAYQRSKNTKVDAIVHDAPEMQFYLTPHWAFRPDWSLDAQYFWIADRHREKNDPRPDIDNYELVNLTLRRKNIAEHWDVALAVRNLFDEDVREPSPYDSDALPAGAYIPNDYPMEGRSIFGEVRYSF